MEGYYRFPALSGDSLIFSAEGDLWTVGLEGGLARRLTTHAGEETHPADSPDGGTLAFAATYEGPSEVYTMPLSAGIPPMLVLRPWTLDSAPLCALAFFLRNPIPLLPDS